MQTDQAARNLVDCTRHIIRNLTTDIREILLSKESAKVKNSELKRLFNSIANESQIAIQNLIDIGWPIDNDEQRK